MDKQLQVEDKKKWGSDYSFPSEGSTKAKPPGGQGQGLKNVSLSIICRRFILELAAAKVERMC